MPVKRLTQDICFHNQSMPQPRRKTGYRRVTLWPSIDIPTPSVVSTGQWHKGGQSGSSGLSMSIGRKSKGGHGR